MVCIYLAELKKCRVLPELSHVRKSTSSVSSRDTRTKNVDFAPDTLRDHPFSTYTCVLEIENIGFSGNLENVING